MKNFTVAMTALGAAALFSVSAHAADRKVMLPIEAALKDTRVEDRLDDGIRFYFGSQPTPKILAKLGSDKTNKKTNAFGKTDEQACNWVFLSALLQLQSRARQLGANAVVNVVSNYKNVEYSSATDFECHAGAVVAGVALKGDFVKIDSK